MAAAAAHRSEEENMAQETGLDGAERAAAIATVVSRRTRPMPGPGQPQDCAACEFLRYFLIVVQEGLTQLYIHDTLCGYIRPYDTREGPRAFFEQMADDSAALMPLSHAAVQALPPYHLAARSEGASANFRTCLHEWHVSSSAVDELLQFLGEKRERYQEELEIIRECELNLCHVGRNLHYVHMTLVLHQDRPDNPCLCHLAETARRWTGIDLETLQCMNEEAPQEPAFVAMEGEDDNNTEDEDCWEDMGHSLIGMGRVEDHHGERGGGRLGL